MFAGYAGLPPGSAKPFIAGGKRLNIS